MFVHMLFSDFCLLVVTSECTKSGQPLVPVVELQITISSQVVPIFRLNYHDPLKGCTRN